MQKISNFSPSNFPILFKKDWPPESLTSDIAQIDRDDLCEEYNALVQCAPRRSDRNKAYFVGHDGKLPKPAKGSWSEKHLARALWNLKDWWPRPNGGQFCLLDYEFPLQMQRSDARLGEIDLLGLTDQGRLMAIELKIKPHGAKSRGKTPAVALMQGLRYAAVVQANLNVIAAEAKRRFSATITAEPPIVQVLAPKAWWKGWLELSGSTRKKAGYWEPEFTKLAQDIENRLGVTVECVALDDDTGITYGSDGKTPQLGSTPKLFPVMPGKNPPIGNSLPPHRPGGIGRMSEPASVLPTGYEEEEATVKLLDQKCRPITCLNEWPRPQDPKKHWKPCHSAMELARFWTETHPPGTEPPLYMNLLKQKFSGVQLHEGRPELETSLPAKGKGRVHDLHLQGSWSGGALTVCVEGKANETFDDAIRDKKHSSPKRLQELLHSVWGVINPTPEQSALRYQLLTALVGTAVQTLRDQKKAKAEDGTGMGMLIVHVFETKLTDPKKLADNHQDLENFVRALPNVDIPKSGIKPDCLYGPVTVTVPADFAPSPTPVSVYLAKLVTVC